MKRIVIILAILIPSSAIAQRQQIPDTAFLQCALSAMHAQRNRALDAQAVYEAKLAGSMDEPRQAGEIKELETNNQPKTESPKK
jgi:hypothetical protein